MKKMHTSLVLIVILVSTVFKTMAHPGHGHEGGSFSLWHYIVEHSHYGIAVAIVAAIVLAVYFYRKKVLTKDARK